MLVTAPPLTVAVALACTGLCKWVSAIAMVGVVAQMVEIPG